MGTSCVLNASVQATLGMLLLIPELIAAFWPSSPKGEASPIRSYREGDLPSTGWLGINPEELQRHRAQTQAQPVTCYTANSSGLDWLGQCSNHPPCGKPVLLPVAPTFEVPPSPAFLEELECYWRDPKAFAHDDRDARTPTSTVMEKIIRPPLFSSISC